MFFFSLKNTLRPLTMYHVIIGIWLTGSVRNKWFAVCVESLPWFQLTTVFESQEELCSDSVERIVVNPNAAYDKFKDKHVGTKGLGQFKPQTYHIILFSFLNRVLYKPPTHDLFTDFSDRISRSRRVGYESGDFEIVSTLILVK